MHERQEKSPLRQSHKICCSVQYHLSSESDLSKAISCLEVLTEGVIDELNVQARIVPTGMTKV